MKTIAIATEKITGLRVVLTCDTIVASALIGGVVLDYRIKQDSYEGACKSNGRDCRGNASL